MDYFTNRILLYNTDESRKSYTVTAGVPQDSVLGLILWIARIALKLADHKTDMVLVRSRKKMEYITITVSEEMITSKQSIKYLEVIIDNRLTFKGHLALYILVGTEQRQCAHLCR